jgi:hypothetical protein
MARRRRFYARDSHGRFSRVAGSRGAYRRKMSTRRKVAYGVAAAAVVGGGALGARQAYRAGARRGYDVGKKQGIYLGKPLRGANGRMRPNAEKRDYSQNPFARGHRSVGPMGQARRNASIGTRIRATNVAMHRVDQNKVAGRRATSGFHAEKRAKDARNRATRSVSNRRTQVQRSAAYRNAQAESQKLIGTARRVGKSAGESAALRGAYAGERASRTARRAAANVTAASVIGTSQFRGKAAKGVPSRAAYSAIGKPAARPTKRTGGSVKIIGNTAAARKRARKRAARRK